ncbi:hypothetical protein A3711_09920 [Erythrobacter sp. HI00D59]|nr:hypothetical protein A3711_09920 [Erythrobacter sp. HI00D59]
MAKKKLKGAPAKGREIDAVVRQIIRMASEGRSELRYSNRPDLEGIAMARNAVKILQSEANSAATE